LEVRWIDTGAASVIALRRCDPMPQRIVPRRHRRLKPDRISVTGNTLRSVLPRPVLSRIVGLAWTAPNGLESILVALNMLPLSSSIFRRSSLISLIRRAIAATSLTAWPSSIPHLLPRRCLFGRLAGKERPANSCQSRRSQAEPAWQMKSCAAVGQWPVKDTGCLSSGLLQLTLPLAAKGARRASAGRQPGAASPAVPAGSARAKPGAV
jgi:hypothetical protein